jgi:hypothetical protein
MKTSGSVYKERKTEPEVFLFMDVSDLRKRILRALDDARKDQSSRRSVLDEASQAYATFLQTLAVPLLKQAVQVLRAEKQGFSINTPADGARLASDASPNTFLEFALDTTGPAPQVIGRVSLAHGRQGRIVEERPIAVGKPVASLTEEDVAMFLVAAIPKLILKP